MASQIEKQDILAVCKKEIMKSLYGNKILITGATGLIGSFYVKCISHLNKTDDANITLYLVVRNRKKADALFADLDDSNINYIESDVCDLKEVDVDVDYIIHGASITNSKMMVTNPVETIDIAIRGTENLLDIARKQKNLKAFLYMSSLEVYGVTDPSLKMITETDYGYIDQLSVRSSYSLGKRMVECICASYASEYNVPVKIVRLTQTFGAGVDYNDGRVFADFARCVIEKRNIILHTKGETVRNYCYLTDAVTALTTALVRGEIGEAYNIANEKTDISIYNMAKMLCKLYPENGIDVVIEDNGNAAKMGYNPTIKVVLSTQKLQALGWQADVGIEDMFKKLITDMAASVEKEI
ncbi:MAG: NAD-dependent epimerase/dehydratase family protein [Ruminococcus sp.]|nr:NAD-dependent epimerase/dehydratase family protein [Ruminococcus sp.]